MEQKNIERLEIFYISDPSPKTTSSSSAAAATTTTKARSRFGHLESIVPSVTTTDARTQDFGAGVLRCVKFRRMPI